RTDVREFGAETKGWAEVVEPGQRPSSSALGVVLRETVIAVRRAENVEARGNAIAPECLRDERIRGVVGQIDKCLRRKTHPRFSPTIFRSQRRAALAIEFAAE